MPSEQHLAEEYSVSRTIIRESLKLLKERGLIDSKTGSGSYVTRPEAQNIADVVYRIIQMDQIDYVSVFDMRMILEMESISRAVNHVTTAEMKEMEHLLELLKDPKLSNEKRSKYDFSFHYMIAKASGNPLLALMTEAIGTICQEMIASLPLAVQRKMKGQRKRQCVDIWSVQNVIMKNICRDSRKHKRR